MGRRTRCLVASQAIPMPEQAHGPGARGRLTAVRIGIGWGPSDPQSICNLTQRCHATSATGRSDAGGYTTGAGGGEVVAVMRGYRDGTCIDRVAQTWSWVVCLSASGV